MKRYYGVFAIVVTAATLLSGGCALVLYQHSQSLFWLPLAPVK